LKYVALGRRGLRVSRLCFGTLTIGPLQRDFGIDHASALLKSAYDLGVTFFDTAEIYGTYPHLKAAFEKQDDVVIATKCYAYDEATARESLEKARRGLGRDVIDIMMLHEQESAHTLRGHSQALEYFAKQRQAGVIRALGVSTHYVAGAAAAAKHEAIDVIHPIFNKRGIGIVDGTAEDMADAMKQAGKQGKGVFAMKPLAGGHMCRDAKNALAFVTDCEWVDCVAVGMQREQEVAYNAAFFSGRRDLPDVRCSRHRLIIHDWCTKCGRCVQACQQGALKMGEEGIEIDQDRCVFCGYCGAACPDFAIKVI